MPTYDFKCPRGHVFEKFYRKVSKTQRVPCPTCGRDAERQISGGAGLVFRGSGFYLTDYGRAGQKPREGDTKPEPLKSEKPAEKPAKADKTEKAEKAEQSPKSKPPHSSDK